MSKRLNYLLEPISNVEIDPQQAVVQMRSSPPSRDEDRSCSYYELMADRSGLSLVRYRAASGQSRTSEPFCLTRQVIVRLLRDMDAAVAEFC